MYANSNVWCDISGRENVKIINPQLFHLVEMECGLCEMKFCQSNSNVHTFL